ncbi:hypothetical protein D3C86_1276940 [compost metagenome]
MMRGVGGSGAEVHHPGLGGGDRQVVLDEGDGLVRQVLAEVIAFFRGVRGLDGVVVIGEIGIPLVGVPAEEAVVALEAAPQGPEALVPREVGIFSGSQVPLAHGERAPAALDQDFRDQGILEGDMPVGAREAGGGLGDACHAVAGGVAAVQEA